MGYFLFIHLLHNLTGVDMANIIKIRYRRILILIVLYGGFLTFLLSTDPRKLPVGWLILPFIWLFLSLFLTFIYIIDWFSDGHRHSRRQSLTAGLLAAIPTSMLLLDSVDQLTLKDIFLIIGLGSLALFYVTKIKLKKDIF